MTIKRLLLGAATVIIVLDVFMVLRVTSRPETVNQFVRSLDAAKIAYPSEDAAVATAHGICRLLDDGEPLLNVVVGEIGAGAVDTFPLANYLVLSAAMAYCPQHVVPRELSKRVV